MKKNSTFREFSPKNHPEKSKTSKLAAFRGYNKPRTDKSVPLQNLEILVVLLRFENFQFFERFIRNAFNEKLLGREPTFFQKNTGVFTINIAFFCRNRLDYQYLGVMKVFEIGSTENFRNHHEDSFDIEYLPVWKFFNIRLSFFEGFWNVLLSKLI